MGEGAQKAGRAEKKQEQLFHRLGFVVKIDQQMGKCKEVGTGINNCVDLSGACTPVVRKITFCLISQ
jgi:hypothetical protein